MSNADALILDLIATGRQATPDEVTTIIQHVAQAPFASYLSRVPPDDRREIARSGIILPPGKIRAVEWHLLKRIYIDEQWPPDTTEEQLVADLHQAILHPGVQVRTYRYNGHPYVSFLAPSHVQNVPDPKRCLFVAYSPVFGTITTGYQASDWSTVLSKEITDVVEHTPSQGSG